MSFDSRPPLRKRRLNLFKKYTSYISGLLGRSSPIGDMKTSTTSIKPGVLIFGGNGMLGSKCIYQLKTHENCWVVSVDYSINPHADVNILMESEEPASARRKDILTAIEGAMGSHKFDAILCLFDGGTCGDAESDLLRSMDEMYKMNMQSSLICTSIAVAYLKRGGLFVLSGSKTGMHPTPGMITYGMSKAAVHHLVKSLAKKDSGMPPEAVIVGILPAIIEETYDTYDRKSSSASENGLTNEITTLSLQHITDLIVKWVKCKDIPSSGTLCQINPDDNRYTLELH